MSGLFDRLWTQVRELEEFDWQDVSRLGCSRETAVRYLRHWRDAGKIRVSRVTRNGKRWYAPTDRPLPGPQPVSGEATPEGNMWRAMRTLRHSFSPVDIAAHANAGGVAVTVEKARAYCRQLLASEHLRVVEMANPPRALTVHAAAIAWYRLLGARAAAFDGAKDAHDAALAFLRQVRKGEASLGDETPEDTGRGNPQLPQISAPQGTFSRDSLKGF